MNIKIKGIYQERTEDAPFIGALICADNCYFNCPNCINEDLKHTQSIVVKDTDIIQEVLSNPFNKGIILGGLEWTLQPQEMIRLIQLALQNKLEVILYTGMTKEELYKNIPEVFNYDIYIKYGKYVEFLKVDNYKMYGVALASSNQKIIKVKGDIMSNKINCTIDDANIILPKYETEYASGVDLRAWKYTYPSDLTTTLDFPEEGLILQPLERVLIKTGLHIELPPNTEAQIRPRSGLALKHGISIVNTPGTIDEDYRGDIGVILINLSNQPFTIKKGDRIAQMVFQKVEKFDLEVVNKLSDTIRGQGGFNSTGTK